MALVALGLGKIFGRNLLLELAVTLQDVLAGLAWTLPLVGLMVVTTSEWAIERWAGLRELRALIQDAILPAIRPLRLPALVVLAIGAGVSEELLFRGAAMAAITSWFPQPLGGMPSGLLLAGKSLTNAHVAAVALSSAVFGLGHAVTPTYFMFASVAGLLFALEYTVTGNMTAPMLTHGIYDFMAFVYLKQIWSKAALDSSVKPSTEDEQIPV